MERWNTIDKKYDFYDEEMYINDASECFDN